MIDETPPFNPPAILDAQGKPARQALTTDCPRCGATADKRVPANGFGVRRPACGQCGYLWTDEVFKELT